MIWKKRSPVHHYSWFSAELNDAADPDARIEIHATTFTDASGISQKVSEENAGFKKRMSVVVRKVWEHNVRSYRIPGS
ncbi:MAG: hypothetical protein EOO04_19900 [Chitinophagaceae bacterium]|nr:MAG: hypothetical protein EOO04_19900 [Chitinophagaceae bacterium]